MKPTNSILTKKDWRGLFVFLLVCISVMYGFSQPINPTYSLSTHTTFEVNMYSIAILDLESTGAGTNLSLSISGPTEAGDGLPPNPLLTNTDLWLNYSCAVQTGTSRKIEVNLLSGSSLPAGFELRLSAANASGAGSGTLGTPANVLTLTTMGQTLINGIQGSFTGSGTNQGHALSYELHFTGANFSVLESEAKTVNILFTIMDD